MFTPKHSRRLFPARKNGIQNGARLLLLACSLFVAAPAQTAEPVILIGNNNYQAFNTGLAPGAWVYVDADPAAGSLARATQRSLGFREVDYKSAVYPTLYFNQVTPTNNGDTAIFNYSAQANKATNLVGFWASKDIPFIIGPDGLAYITDGHHTTAGYLAPASPVRQLVPGKNRVILGHVVTNFYDASVGPQPVDDAWWTARAAANNALLYGPEGGQLTLPGELNYDILRPILPSVLAMPSTPSNLTTNGAVAMALSTYRSLAWGLADAVVQAGIDSKGAKIVGFKKTPPNSSVDINFVEFFWADYLRHRVVWDDTLTGSPYSSGNGDANVTAAPLSFFTATANGIALARSKAYLDEHGRNLLDYTNSAVFGPNTVNWANGTISNGLAVATDTYNLYLRDDSTIVGAIQPSAVSTNILHIDTVSGMVVTQALQNIRTAIVNGGGTLSNLWKDITVSNVNLILPAGTGVVTVTGTNFVASNILLGGGTLLLEGSLRGNVLVTNGVLQGGGIVEGALTTSGGGTLAPGASIRTLTVNGALTLGGIASMEANKSGATFMTDQVIGISTLTYGGTLTLVVNGDALAEGDAFKLFDATTYLSAFASFNLPALDPGLSWDTSRLIVDGTLVVISGDSPLSFAAQPASQIRNVGTTVTLLGGAVGTVPITYQWQFNGSDLEGQTGPALVLANIQEGNQGTYRFTARNSTGFITSETAVFTVNQFPVAGPDTLATKKNLAVSVPALSLLANDSDLDGDALTLTITDGARSTNGATVTLKDKLVTYAPTLNFLGRDQFIYTLSDGNAIKVGTVIVSVTSANLPPTNQVAIALSAAGRLIRFAGAPAKKYAIQTAGDVTGPWSNLSTNLTALPDGFVEFEDVESPAPATRFYRALFVP